MSTLGPWAGVSWGQYGKKICVNPELAAWQPRSKWDSCTYVCMYVCMHIVLHAVESAMSDRTTADFGWVLVWAGSGLGLGLIILDLHSLTKLSSLLNFTLHRKYKYKGKKRKEYIHSL